MRAAAIRGGTRDPPEAALNGSRGQRARRRFDGSLRWGCWWPPFEDGTTKRGGGGWSAAASAGWVQWLVIRRRCERSKVSGVTGQPSRRDRKSAAAIDPSTVRSSSVSCGRLLWRRRAMISSIERYGSSTGIFHPTHRYRLRSRGIFLTAWLGRCRPMAETLRGCRCSPFRGFGALVGHLPCAVGTVPCGHVVIPYGYVEA